MGSCIISNMHLHWNENEAHPTCSCVDVCISSNIPASSAYGVNISQLIRFSRDCAQYIDFLYRAQLLMQMLRKQGYVAPRLKSSLHKLYGRHHNLVDR